MASSAFVALFLLLAGAVTILFAGVRLARVADELADRTGWGEAVTGAVLLGGMTSLPGLAASLTGAWTGHPEMAVSNALGGIAAQTLFLVVADLAHRPANLEHAAASDTNLFSGTLLIGLLALPAMASNVAFFAEWRIHPVTPVMFVTYAAGIHMARRVRREAMWRPTPTEFTTEDVPESRNRRRSLAGLIARFLFYGSLTGGAGLVVGHAGVGLIESAGWREGVVGGILTAIVSSLPELVTTMAAVRRGAMTLAVSGIVGGNAFDTLFVAASDLAYREGSIYHAIGERFGFLLAGTIVMTAILLAGLIRRQRHGVGNIGFEGWLLLAVYAVLVTVMSA